MIVIPTVCLFSPHSHQRESSRVPNVEMNKMCLYDVQYAGTWLLPLKSIILVCQNLSSYLDKKLIENQETGVKCGLHKVEVLCINDFTAMMKQGQMGHSSRASSFLAEKKECVSFVNKEHFIGG